MGNQTLSTPGDSRRGLRRDVSLRAAGLLCAIVSLALIAVQPLGENLQRLVARRIEFRARHFLHRDPPLDPRLKIYALGDSSLNELQTESLSLAEWALVLNYLASARPRAVLIDKVFSAPAGAERAAEFVTTLKHLPFPVIGSAFVAAAPIPDRPLQPASTLAAWFAPGADAEREFAQLEDLPIQVGFPYGPSVAIRDAFAKVGHILYDGDLEIRALLRTSRYEALPATALLTARELRLQAGSLFADGRRVPMDERGRMIANLSAPETYGDRMTKLSALLRHARNRDPLELPSDSVVLILPGMYTGGGDMHGSPFGPLAGGYLVASLVNSTLTGRWIRQPLPSVWAVLLGGLLAFACWLGGAKRALPAQLTLQACGCAGGVLAFALADVELPWLAAMGSLLLNNLALAMQNQRAASRHWVESGEVESDVVGLSQLDRVATGLVSVESPLHLGRYRILEKIGEGGMGEVYRAKTFGPGGFEKEFALKRTRIHQDIDEVRMHRFEEEARLHSILLHSNIAQVFEFFRVGDNYLLVMEFVDGRNLSELLRAFRQRHRALPLAACLYIVDEMCQGLEYAHEKKDPASGAALNLVHRDISPSNVMISSTGEVKLIDFGIAKGTFQRDRSEVGMVKGKLRYMSPEQAGGEAIDARTDLYATALVLYELLTGAPAFAGDTDAEVLAQARAPHIPAVRTQRPEVPAALEAVLARTLAVDPAKRFASAAALREALSPFWNPQERSGLRHLLSGIVTRRGEDLAIDIVPSLADLPRKARETVAARAGAIPRRMRKG